jgi:hypothetical protein
VGWLKIPKAIKVKSMNKCPHCEKDINPDWGKSETQVISSDKENLFYKIIPCLHCEENVFQLYKGFLSSDRKRWLSEAGAFGTKNLPEGWNEKPKLIFQYPSPTTKIGASGVPREIKDYFNEAEKCFSVGAFNGAADCLRSCIYELCVALKAEGKDYKEKITNLFPPNDSYAELARQVKWLGDNHAHNKRENYTPEDVATAITSVPLIIREIYSRPSKAKELANALRKPNSKTGKGKKNG